MTTTYTATVEQHRLDYNGVLQNSPAVEEFSTIAAAKAFVAEWFEQNGSAMRFAVIEGTDDYYNSTGTDPMPGEWDYDDEQAEADHASAQFDGGEFSRTEPRLEVKYPLGTRVVTNNGRWGTVTAFSCACDYSSEKHDPTSALCKNWDGWFIVTEDDHAPVLQNNERINQWSAIGRGSKELTITETRRRLKAGVAALREIDPDITTGLRIEVHTRAMPVVAYTPEQAKAWWQPEGDDLWDFQQWDNAHREEQFRQDGAIVHIAFSTTGDWGELVDTRVVWLGTADHAPLVLDRRNGDRK